MQLQELIAANQQTLKDAELILQHISDDTYRRVTEPFKAPLGRHMRHITDHYIQLMNGISGSRVDYDARERNVVVENDKTEMLQLITSINKQLSALGKVRDSELSVILSVDENARTPEVRSTLSRELVFLQSHTTHHCAIISAMLKLEGIPVPEDFGIAASTLKYDHQQCAH